MHVAACISAVAALASVASGAALIGDPGVSANNGVVTFTVDARDTCEADAAGGGMMSISTSITVDYAQVGQCRPLPGQTGWGIVKVISMNEERLGCTRKFLPPSGAWG
jgi:hypothetical protein